MMSKSKYKFYNSGKKYKFYNESEQNEENLIVDKDKTKEFIVMYTCTLTDKLWNLHITAKWM